MILNLNVKKKEKMSNLAQNQNEQNEQNEQIFLINKITGKRSSFKLFAKPNCARCEGTGYIGVFKSNCNGRCFKCIPDSRWTYINNNFEITWSK